MVDMRVQASATPARTSKDGLVIPQALRDLALVTADWPIARAMEGRVITAMGGTATTPLTFGAGSIDTTEPDFALSIPSTVVVTLLEITVVMEAFGSTGIFEGMAATGTGGVFGTDTNLVVGTTITNARSDAPYSSLCSAGVASNADATYMTTNVSEFWRFGKNKVVDITTADDDSTDVQTVFRWSHKDSAPQVLYGDGTVQLMIFAAGVAGTGFIQVKWVEEPISMLS